MTKNFIYTASALLLGSAITLTSCQSEEDFGQMGGNGEVLLTVTANRGVAGSRTSFEESEGNLITNWNEGDQLVVTDATGANLGVLTIVSGQNTSEGVFEGTIKLGDNENVNIVYLGSGYEGDLEEVSNKVVFNISAQDGTFAGLTEKDYLTETAPVTKLNGTEATAKVNMTRSLAHGYFTLALPDGVTLAAGDQITITANEGLYAQRTLKLGVFGISNLTTANTITVTKTEAGNDFYLTVIPSTFAPQFTVVKDDVTYTASLASRSWSPAEYVRANENNDPVKITDWSYEKMPTNPGDMGNWGSGNNIFPDFTNIGWTRTTDYGWTVNMRNLEPSITGGFGTYITYNSNGITGTDLLFSDKKGYCYLFQWGRWMGFTPDTQRTQISSYGSWSPEPNNSQEIPGVDWLNDKTVGYIFGNGLPFAYAWIYASGNWSKQNSLDYSLVYGACSSLSNTMDYMSDNSLTTWEARCGNPCPDGYRIPTAAELEVLIPNNVETINRSHAEVKTINGKKYAMKWVVNTSVTPYRLEISSVPTTKTSVTVNDAIFADATVIYLHAMGYLNWECKYTGKNEVGAYWSNEMAALSDKNGNGGKYLEIDFNGNTVTMGMDVTYTCMGLCVIPIKDSEAKASSITPLFPYAH